MKPRLLFSPFARNASALKHGPSNNNNYLYVYYFILVIHNIYDRFLANETIFMTTLHLFFSFSRIFSKILLAALIQLKGRYNKNCLSFSIFINQFRLFILKTEIIISGLRVRQSDVAIDDSFNKIKLIYVKFRVS